MLLGGSMTVRFLLGLIIASITITEEVSAAKTKFVRPDYSEYYSAAAKDHPGSATSASEHIYEHIERDPLGIEKYISRGFRGDEEKGHETKADFSYVPYEVPVKELAKYKRENEYEAAIDALDKEYSVPTTYKLKDDIKLDGAESVKPESSNDAVFESKSPKYSLDESTFGGGGSEGGQASGGFQYKIPHYYTRHTETPVNDKYVKSSSHNYDYQPSEIQGASLKSSNCKKIVKEGASKDIPMTCHVCKDPKTGAKSEQCSYTSAPEPKSFYSAKNEKYSQPHKAENIRFRRYAPKKEDDEFVDPYEYIKAESQKYFSKPKEFESEYYKPKDYYEEYKFPQDYFAGDSSIKSESEVQSEKLVKEGGVCKEVVKNNMKCKVCKNEKTGGNYEQCSYTSAPSEKKYAYVSERKFDGDGNPIEDKVEESSEPKATKVEKPRQEKSSFERKLAEVKSEEKKQPAGSRGSRRAKLIDDNPYDVPKHFVEDTQSNEKLRIPGLNPELYGSADSSFESQKEKYAPDEYQERLFSKAEQQASNEAKQKLQEFQTEDNKKDVEKVLEEFSKKDRSSCKKAHKNGMTCYLCVNKEGTQHEECMYVAANSPQVSHVAYHEVEEFKNKGKPEAAASTLKETEVNAPVKRKRFFKKVTSVPSNIQAAPSDIKPTKTKYVSTPVASSGASFKTPRKLRRSRNFSGTEPVFAESKIQETIVKRPNYKEPNLPTPQEFVVGEAEGAFSSETKPVYSKAFGVTLPRYMLEKSEFEKNFDEFSSS